MSTTSITPETVEWDLRRPTTARELAGRSDRLAGRRDAAHYIVHLPGRSIEGPFRSVVARTVGLEPETIGRVSFAFPFAESAGEVRSQLGQIDALFAVAPMNRAALDRLATRVEAATSDGAIAVRQLEPGTHRRRRSLFALSEDADVRAILQVSTVDTDAVSLTVHADLLVA